MCDSPCSLLLLFIHECEGKFCSAPCMSEKPLQKCRPCEIGQDGLSQGSRLCLAVPGGGAQPKGVLLGSSPGGSILYIEPPAAVPLNNDLAAARGEAYAAEEAVLWRVTGEVMGEIDMLQHSLDTVRRTPA